MGTTCATCAHFVDHDDDDGPQGQDEMRDGYCLMDGSCVWADDRCWSHEPEAPPSIEESEGLDIFTPSGEYYGAL